MSLFLNRSFAETAAAVKKCFDEFTKIEDEIQYITNEASNFGLPLVDLKFFGEVSKEINEAKVIWGPYFAFQTELDAISNKNWMEIQQKAFSKLQDFSLSWMDKLKKMKKDVVYLAISRKLDSFKGSLPVFRYLQGENFEREHWKSLFNTLQFDNSVTKENLKFSHFLDKAALLVKKQKFIKDLYTRAQAEVVIRNAISEIQSFLDNTCFSLSFYKNKNKELLINKGNYNFRMEKHPF